MADHEHWDRVYETRQPGAVSWYAPHLGRSLELLDEAGVPLDAGIIDVGGGASTLPRDLLELGYRNLTVLDISAAALDHARAALGADAERIEWVVGDVTQAPLPKAAFALWHDRAVFHFLTDEADRAAYLRQVDHALAPGGQVIIATFGAEGPEECSGLPVVRYDDESLLRQLGAVFQRVRCVEDTHQTPWGSQQAFIYCLCRRREA